MIDAANRGMPSGRTTIEAGGKEYDASIAKTPDGWFKVTVDSVDVVGMDGTLDSAIERARRNLKKALDL